MGFIVLTLHTNNSVEKQTAKIVTLQWTLRRHLSAPAFRRKLSAKNHELIKSGLDSLPSELFACNSQGHPISTSTNKVGPVLAHADLRIREYEPNWAIETTQLYNDGQRANDDSMAMIRFFHTRKSVGIRFVGPAAIRLAVQYTHMLCEMVNQIFDSNKFRRTTESVDAQFKSEYLCEYVIDTLVLPVNILNRQMFTELQWVERLIHLDIRRQANMLGIALPKNFALRVVQTEGVKYSVKVNGSVLPVYSGLKVHSNLKLTGHWAAGSLISKGHGTIISDRDNAAPRADAQVSGTYGIDPSEMESLYGKPVFSFPPGSLADHDTDYL